MPTAAISSECSALLADARRHGPLYGPGFSNHLPMALIALDRMRAPPAVLERFADSYRQRLQPAGADDPVTDPLPLLGQGVHYAGLERFFNDAVTADGEEAVLRRWLPVLWPGLAAAGFHAMIRLAYALEAGERGELCAALAFWVLAYKPLPVPPGRTDETLDGIAARIAAATGEGGGTGQTIGARMATVERSPALAGAQPASIALRDVATFALAAFHASEDFMLLHTVTACHAFRTVAPCLDNEEATLRQLWQAVLVAWLAAQREGRRAVPTRLGWSEIQERATRSTDDHVIKLCHTARAEDEQYGDPRYLEIAARAVTPR
ncbi:questin oxidase family protein [Pseudoduganella lutea]|uniref:Questin oxidase family protein n=1 Tax=Pseudoduganella lutea TaxID=321985 RepID=A0A4P6KVX5_9BURK|nr:questin oxidase family protein [Pseudoduganella lutea]QBE62602.1 questin oxidase family protein [Pseudoduganella lutea]